MLEWAESSQAAGEKFYILNALPYESLLQIMVLGWCTRIPSLLHAVHFFLLQIR